MAKNNRGPSLPEVPRGTRPALAGATLAHVTPGPDWIIATLHKPETKGVILLPGTVREEFAIMVAEKVGSNCVDADKNPIARPGDVILFMAGFLRLDEIGPNVVLINKDHMVAVIQDFDWKAAIDAASRPSVLAVEPTQLILPGV